MAVKPDRYLPAAVRRISAALQLELLQQVLMVLMVLVVLLLVLLVLLVLLAVLLLATSRTRAARPFAAP